MPSKPFSPDAHPTEEDLKVAAAALVRDEKGNKVAFGSVYENQKTIIVFIRHFFCGVCQAYVTQLAEIPSAALEAAGVKIVVVGCGDYSLMTHYKEASGFTGEIYADSSRELYTALGMTLRNLKGAPAGSVPRSYVPKSVLKVTLSSILDALKQPLNAFTGKNGDIAQLGGDFVLGPGNQCTFVHRMENSQDHLDVPELIKHAGVELSPASDPAPAAAIQVSS